MRRRIDLRAFALIGWTLGCGGTQLLAGPGPDEITGHVQGLEQFGRVGAIGSGIVGLGLGTTSCNVGDLPIAIDQLPQTNHPVLMANLYRLQTVDGSDRLEQIGQSWVKHSFGSSNLDECGSGCPAPGPLDEISPGCSDAYAAIQFDPCGFVGTPAPMAHRSVIHPYRGLLPSSVNYGPGGGCDSNYAMADHRDHVHTGISHRLQVRDEDLMPALNPGARYFAEGQYVVGSEYALGNGNQGNNVGHRSYDVFGPDVDGLFTFSTLATTVPESPAIDAWPGSAKTLIQPAPLADGDAYLAYKVTDLGGGLWHYEYILYNMNMDLSLGAFRVPLPAGVAISNVGFHAPLNHAPEPNTDNYTNDPWVSQIGGGEVAWATDSHDVDPLANAVRFGTAYNFRFDADAPPRSVFANVSTFKIAMTLRVATLGPAPPGPQDCDGNGIDDTCDLDCGAPGCAVPGCGTATDCDGTGVPDACEIDCNGNGVDDRCDIAAGASLDCIGNGIPDECEIDCDGNGEADSCDMLAGVAADCNGNGLLDSCDIAGGTPDGNGNGIPDVCECAAPEPPTPSVSVVAQNRFIAVGGNVGQPTAIRVTFVELPPPMDAANGLVWWVGEPHPVSELGSRNDDTPPTFMAAKLRCDPFYADWAAFGAVHVYHEGIVPGGTYAAEAFFDGCAIASPPATMTTGQWADVVGAFDTGSGLWAAPDGSVDVASDVVSVLDKFASAPGSPSKSRADLEPALVDLKINITDVTSILDAFGGAGYPFAPTITPCP